MPDGKKRYVSWRKYSRNRLQVLLRNDHTLMTEHASVDGNAKALSISLAQAMTELTEEREVESADGNTWFNASLNSLKQRRDEAYKLYKRTRSEESWQQYKLWRNKYVRELRFARNGSVRREIEKCNGDPKRLWKCLKSLITPGGAPKSAIIFEGESIPCSEKETARRINEFFVNSVNEIHNSIPEPCTNNTGYNANLDSRFRAFQPVTFQKLVETVRGLKKCSGTDNITKQVLADIFGCCWRKIAWYN